jgi:hypothetical protein
MRLYAYYYGGMHQCPERNREVGYPFDEWGLLSNSTETTVPLLGQWDDSKIETLEKEIILAKTYGVNGFIMNFYHNGDWAELYKPIDAFCSASNSTGVKFALNWCYRMPRRLLPVSLNYKHKKTRHLIHSIIDQGKNIETNLAGKEIHNIIKYAAEKYFCNQHYIKIGNKLYFSIYHVTGLLTRYGITGVNNILSRLREEALQFGYDLHIVGLLSMAPEDTDFDELIQSTDFDALTAYCCLPDFRIALYSQDYQALYKRRITEWKICRQIYQKNFYPCIAAGWNASARGEKGYDPHLHGLLFPWAPIVVNDTPKHFQAYLKSAIKYARENLQNPEQVVILGPWNEWSEGCYLLPDTRYGYGKLEAIKSAKNHCKL